jgi:hypothetical protein
MPVNSRLAAEIRRSWATACRTGIFEIDRDLVRNHAYDIALCAPASGHPRASALPIG